MNAQTYTSPDERRRLLMELSKEGLINLYVGVADISQKELEEKDRRIKELQDFVAEVARGQHGELKAGFIHRIMGQAKQLLTDK